jgi:hypothetical protein
MPPLNAVIRFLSRSRSQSAKRGARINRPAVSITQHPGHVSHEDVNHLSMQGSCHDVVPQHFFGDGYADVTLMRDVAPQDATHK